MGLFYKTREGGATVTVFVPYDCDNHCPFCINKEEYQNPVNFRLDAILKSIAVMNDITPYCDFVFTGGEPFANLDALQEMVDAVPRSHKIYINTTFPIQKRYSVEKMLDFVRCNNDKVTCLNISRHLSSYVEECPDAILERLAAPVRINCVLLEAYPSQCLVDFVERFRPYCIPIQFRFDYTKTTPENLYGKANDPILQTLCHCFAYRGLDGCRMRNGFHFSYRGMHLTYHKTLPYSTITEVDENGTSYDILYDIVIKQNGTIHSDWTGIPLDVERYRSAIFEPYDLCVLDGVVNF